MSAVWLGVTAHLWQTTMVLALLATLALLLKRAPARYLEALWTAGLLKLLVPLPLLGALWPALQRLATSAGQQHTIGPAVKTLSQLAYPEMLWIAPLETGNGRLSPAIVVAATSLWALGAATLLAAWWRRGRRPVPLGDEPWRTPAGIGERVTHAARAANVPLGRIRITDAAVVPCVRNLRKPLVVLSRAVVEALSADELCAVLVHENSHCRRGDLWRGAVQAITARLYFFYPPAWWLERRLRESAELACDEAVLASGITPSTYARALARTVDLGLAPTAAPALSSNRSRLRARLQRIKDPERYAAMNHHRFAVIAAFVAAVGLSLVPVADSVGLVAAVGESPMQGGWLPAEQITGLNGLETTVTVTYTDAPLAWVLEDLGRRAGFDVYFMSQADPTLEVQVGVVDTSVREVLGLVAGLRGLEYRVVDANTLIVRVRGGRPGDLEAMVRAPEGEGPVREMRKAPAPEGSPMRVGGDIEEPERIHYVAPEYPEEARAARIEGLVILQATIDRQGNVKDLAVLRGVGGGLDEAAVTAVKEWKYTPTFYNGEPVEVIFTVNVAFRLVK